MRNEQEVTDYLRSLENEWDETWDPKYPLRGAALAARLTRLGSMLDAVRYILNLPDAHYRAAGAAGFKRAVR